MQTAIVLLLNSQEFLNEEQEFAIQSLKFAPPFK